MQYQVMLSPDLGLNAVELAAAWNADPELRKCAVAGVERAQGGKFDLDPVLLVTLTLVSQIVINLSANFIFEGLMQKVGDRATPQPALPVSVRREIEVKEIAVHPDGSVRTLVVTMREETGP